MTDLPGIQIELAEERLWQGGRPVGVKKKVFDLLRFFVEHPDRLLTKQTILEGVWPDTHVSDASVKDCVKNLRVLLRDDPRNPAFIKTVRGRGYRYLGGIDILDPDERRSFLPSAVATLRDKSAVAVLPFKNLSADPEQEYISDGLSEEIITLLSAWRLFPVIARSSSFVFKDLPRDVREIAKDLSARYVIEGSVRKSGEHLRVSAQLIDGDTGHTLWAEKFDSPLDDIFQIQDDITTGIVASVEPHIEAAERLRVKTRQSSNLDAWDHYLRARELMHKITPGATAKARDVFQTVIELDPAYADAYAGLSHTYQREILFELAEDNAVCGQNALKAAERAVALDNTSSVAHLALGGAYIWLNRHHLSIAETRTAVELNPSNIQALLALGNRLDIVGNALEGMPLMEKALKLHPRDPHSHIYFAQLARAYINARDFEKALECLYESVRRIPSYPHTYHVLAICLGHLGRREEARDAARRCNELHPGFMTKRAHWNIYLDPRANNHLTEGLRKAGLLGLAPGSD